MFNLLMAGRDWAATRDTFMATRVLEHTTDAVLARFCPNGVLDVDAVTRIPSLFASETRYDNSQGPARVGKLIRVTRQGRSDYALEYVFDQSIPPIPNSALQALSRELGITEFEFSRTHWAIKEADLFEVLYRSQLSVRPQARVFRLLEGAVDEDLTAVMMPFSAEFSPVYVALQDAAVNAGMRCVRADDIWSDDHIIQDIVDLVCKANVVVCDLTGRNPNVFYEMGIAHTLGKDVIILTQSPHDVPFDVQGIRYIKYLNNREGLDKLSKDVAGRLETLRRRR